MLGEVTREGFLEVGPETGVAEGKGLGGRGEWPTPDCISPVCRAQPAFANSFL